MMDGALPRSAGARAVIFFHAFSFFTPVFGVFLSGALILGEFMGPNLITALVLVSLGMVMVNRGPAHESSKGPVQGE